MKASHNEKNEIKKLAIVVPENIDSKRGLMLWLLEQLGKEYNRVSCKKALDLLKLDDTSNNRSQWYNVKSEFKHSLQEFERASKYHKPRVSYHNFNDASVFFGREFRLKRTALAIKKGWVLTNAKNRYLQWNDKRGWCRWFETGRARLHVRKPVTDGKILQFLADAFYNTGLIEDIKEFTAFYRSFFLKSAKLTVHLGKKSRIPRFRLEFDNGINKLVVMNDDSHPHDIEIQYYLSKEGEQLRQYLGDSQKCLDYSTQTNIQLMEALKEILSLNGLDKTKGLSVGSGGNPFVF